MTAQTEVRASPAATGGIGGFISFKFKYETLLSVAIWSNIQNVKTFPPNVNLLLNTFWQKFWL